MTNLPFITIIMTTTTFEITNLESEAKGQSKMRTDKKVPDQTALNVAKAAQDATRESTIILFGSRARGDNRPDSDIDLLLVYKDRSIAEQSKAEKAISEYFRKNPPSLKVDILTMSREDFDYCRRAQNHIAGQASSQGVVMTGERFNYNDYEDKYPKSWPDVKMRLRITYRNLRALEHNIDGLPDDIETYAFHGQQAVENSLKGWLSAAEINYERTHGLVDLSEKIFEDPKESSTLAAAQLKMLMDYTTVPDPEERGETLNWLTKFAVEYRYGEAEFSLDEVEREQFGNQINLAAYTFINRAQELTNTTDEDLK